MKLNKRYILTIASMLLVGCLAYFVKDKPDLYQNAYFSEVIYDRSGNVLRITLSKDDIYRVFTKIEELPHDIKDAVLLYEDRFFYYHFGFNPIALLKAGIETLFGQRRRGASTITMQLARLVYKIDTTSVLGKIDQISKAILIEIYYSKPEILESYLNLTPYGHNIEGIGAASLIYFKQKPEKITLPESLLLAVIPQNPLKRTPTSDKGFKEMEKARQMLAKTWHEKNDNEDAFLPIKVYKIRDIPFLAPHFTVNILKENGKEKDIRTSIDISTQEVLEKMVEDYLEKHEIRGVKNASVLLYNYKTLETVSYIGSANFFDKNIQGQVDGVKALRSPGSAMKPFIYGLALDQGLIHPMTMMIDMPKQFGIYTPENFDRNFMGAISATESLIQSRNVPAVDLLLKLQRSSFYDLLKKSGVEKMKSEDFYGLALALGGFEISLQNMVDLYSMLGNKGVFKDGTVMLSKEAAYLMLDMLAKNKFSSDLPDYIRKGKLKIAWKTGTSYSYKDAWTIGVFKDFVLGIWIGNFDGEPNPSFVGRGIASPLFFEIINFLNKEYDMEDFNQDIEGLNLKEVDICKGAFDLAGANCPLTEKSFIIPMKSPIKVSNIHKLIPINIKSGLRSCYKKEGETFLKLYEIWPSDVYKVFERAGIYKELPPAFENDCLIDDTESMGNPPKIVYPTKSLIYTIRANDFKSAKIPFTANIDSDAKKVYWFVNNSFIGESKKNEPILWNAVSGDYTITATDDLGRQDSSKIKVEIIQ